MQHQPDLTTLIPNGTGALPAKRAIIYCRVSSPHQKDNGSLEDQEKRGRAWCIEHNYEIIAIYKEVYSGEDIDRPLLDQVREEIRKGEIDIIVADKVDRFSRADPAITAYVMVEAEQYGCRVEFVEIQDDSFEGQILSAVLAIVARVEHKRIKERLSGGKKRRLHGDPQKGKAPRLMPGNIPRYGWKYRDEEKTAYDLEPHQAAIMQRIYHELGVQGRSLYSICADLEAEHEPPPAEAQARAGYKIGKRRASMRWHAGSVARMLKEPCYWGEPIANRYEKFVKEVRDPQTNRIRKIRRTRYRATNSEEIIPYSTGLWPPIISKELAMKALARLTQNQLEAERNLKNTGLSFLRAGYIFCGYCGARMVLHNHRASKETESVLRFVCGARRSYKAKQGRGGANPQDCNYQGQFSIRVSQVENAVWEHIVHALTDPNIVPNAYERLNSQERERNAQYKTELQTLNKLIKEASTRRENYMEAIGQTNVPDIRAGLLKLATEEGTKIRSWEKRRDGIERNSQITRNETAQVRSFIASLNSQVAQMLQATVAERRKIADALGVRVAVYRADHMPWIEMASNLPGVEASWHAQKRHRAEPLVIRDDRAILSSVVLSETVHKWTAPVARKETARDEQQIAEPAEATAR